jgi:hypothetical protein
VAVQLFQAQGATLRAVYTCSAYENLSDRTNNYSNAFSGRSFLDIVKYKEPVVRGILGKLSFLPQVMTFLTFGERLGLILLTQTSAVSACAIVVLLAYIVVG